MASIVKWACMRPTLRNHAYLPAYKMLTKHFSKDTIYNAKDIAFKVKSIQNFASDRQTYIP